MSAINGLGGGLGGVDRVLALRAQILERNEALQRASAVAPASPVSPVAPTGPANSAGPVNFASAFENAINKVNDSETRAGQLTDAYERGETIDIAKVMLARQEAGVAFEATLQVRNKLLSAYKDILSIPV